MTHPAKGVFEMTHRSLNRTTNCGSSGKTPILWHHRVLPQLFLFLLTTIVLLASSGCKKDEPSTPAEGGATQRTTLTIGAILPLTGDAGAYGQSMKRGMELASSQVTGDLEILFEDSQADPKQAVSAFQKLRDVNKVSLILGPFTSGETLAVAPLAERDQTVIISTGASAPEVSDAGEYVFRIVTSDLYDADVVARYVSSELQARQPAILYINNAYGRGVHDAFRAAVADIGGTLVAAEAYHPSAVDYRPIIQRVAAANPDVLFLVGHQEMGRMVRLIREAGIDVAIMSTGLFEDPAIVQSAGAHAEDVHYSYASFDPDDAEPLVADFVRAYSERYASAPDIVAALGFDAVRLVADVTECKELPGDEMKSRLLKVQGFSGVTGDMTFDEQGDVLKSFGIKKVEDGQFVWVHRRF